MSATTIRTGPGTAVDWCSGYQVWRNRENLALPAAGTSSYDFAMAEETVRTVAFFDVDETLINARSMYRFLEFSLAATGRPAAEYERLRAEFTALAKAGVAREDINRLFYRPFAGQPVAEVYQLGREWFAGERRSPAFFHLASVGALALHRGAGHLTALVSGSFPACVAPIAEAIGADAVLCTVPDQVDGSYTGAIGRPMIGVVKAEAARGFAGAHDANIGACWAYGDHASDLELLGAVGNPVVVGDDAVLREYAETRGWRRLAPSGGFAETTVPREPGRRPAGIQSGVARPVTAIGSG
jgi:HAD superfamily hydrolase (TIGR01490 family)